MAKFLEDRLETASERTLVKAIKELHSKKYTPEGAYSHFRNISTKCVSSMALW